MTTYATIDDITTLYRELTPAETERAEALLVEVSAILNYEATKVGKNLEQMVDLDENLKEVYHIISISPYKL